MKENGNLSLQTLIHQCLRSQVLESGTHGLKRISISVFPTIADPYSTNPTLTVEDAKHETWRVLTDQLL